MQGERPCSRARFSAPGHRQALPFAPGKGRRGTPGTAGPLRLRVKRKRHEISVTARCRKIRRPACGVSRLAPYEPRWSYPDPLFKDPLLSTAGRASCRHAVFETRSIPDPEALVTRGYMRRASYSLGRRVWAAKPIHGHRSAHGFAWPRAPWWIRTGGI